MMMKHLAKIQVEFLRYANLQNDISKAEKSSKKSIFLGGMIDEKDKWRKEIKKSFEKRFNFLDPFDINWEAEDDIYNECEGLLKADYIFFYKPGKQSEKEKEFLKNFDKEYFTFNNIDEINDFLIDI